MMNHTETVHELVKDLMNRLAITESIEDIVKEYKKKDDSPDSFSRFISGLLGDRTKPKPQVNDIPEPARKVLFPWYDVLASMYVYPDEEHIVRTTCPECGKRYAQLHFSSPSWTWRALCGRAGTMTICPSCLKQESFILEIMN